MAALPFPTDFYGMAESLPSGAAVPVIFIFLSLLFFTSFFRNRHALRAMKYLLSAAVILPAVFLPAAAQENDEPEIHLGTGNIENPAGQGIWNYVYYGTFDGKPLKYRVLNNFEDGFSSEDGPYTMLLDCDSVIREWIFGDNKIWAESNVKLYLNGEELSFLGGMTAAERDAIAESIKASPNSDDGSGTEWLNFAPLGNGDKVFLLDAKEVTSSGRYGYGYSPHDPEATECDVREKKNLAGENSTWFLRSPHAENFNSVGLVDEKGLITTVVDVLEHDNKGVSPAFNIKEPSIIFSSAVNSDKNEYKLTVLDKDITVTIDPLSIEGVEITIPYKISGAHAGNVTRVIALITNYEFSDESGWWVKPAWDRAWQVADILRKKTAATANGAAEGTLKLSLEYGWNNPLYFDKWDKEYYIYVIAEDENAGVATNYASLPVKVSRPAHEHNWSYSASGNTITAQCTAPLHVSGDAKLIIEPPTRDEGQPVYDGQVHEASLRTDNDQNGLFDPENTKITYYLETENGLTPISGSPVNVGKYTAKATAHNQTISETYSIYPATVQVHVKDQTIAEGSNTISSEPDQAELLSALEGHKISRIVLYVEDDNYVDGAAIKADIHETKIADADNNDVTNNYVIMHNQWGTLTVKPAINYQVTFEVVNGLWDDTMSSDPRNVTLSGYEGQTLTLSEDQIPTAGENPNEDYQKKGSWDTEPDTTTAITGPTSFTYTYDPTPVSYSVTFNVKNGLWDDTMTSDSRSVTLAGYKHEILTLSADQIPTAGTNPDENYQEGSWDTEPDTTTRITGNTDFTYTYDRIPVSYQVTFKVVNGLWDDTMTSSERNVTLDGYKDEKLTLGSDQIPTAGGNPDENYQEGSWDTEPDTTTAITDNTVFTYTYDRIPVSYQVTFKVVNGLWDDTMTSAERNVTLDGYKDEKLTLSSDQIPTVGGNPDENYQEGSWDTEPDTTTAITDNTVFTYTYDRIPVSYQVTFAVVNGLWDDDMTSADRNVTLDGYKDENLTLSSDQIPAAGGNPDENYQEGSWDTEPDTTTAITGNTVYTYTYARIPVRYEVTFKVVNGLWGDGSSEDKTAEISGYADETLKLAEEQIPGVGSDPYEHYQEGSWDPALDTPVSDENKVFTYTYSRIPVSYQVSFNVVNGLWDDKSPDEKTVTLSGYEDEELKLSEDQIPGVGSDPYEHYQEGSWDTAPDTETPITGDTAYTYTYGRIPVSYQVTFRVLNGLWDDEEYESKAFIPKGSAERIVTLSGYEDEDLVLSADQIPAAGGKPDAGYTAGSWDTTPDTETPIMGDTVFTYSYSRITVSYTVTFKVVNGLWDDKSSADKAVTLSGYEGDELTLSAEQIPAAGNEPDTGYMAGSWDTTPDPGTPITGDTVFTYTYAENDEPDDPDDPHCPCCCCHCILPPTGFSGKPSALSAQPEALKYSSVGMRLMIPSLDVDSELVTVPLDGDTWAVEWLGEQSGILEGSALPGAGISMIAAHNSLNDLEAGPFALLSLLETNDVIAVSGKRNDLKFFRVFANELLAPDDMKTLTAIAGRETDTLVLITCENESVEGGYLNRRVIFAKPIG